MATAFQLRIVTPKQQLLDEQVREVTAPGTIGEFGVLPDHITFLTSLEIGSLSFRTERGARTLAVRGGFAEVANNVMTVLADDAVFAEDIDAAAARRELEAAEELLQGMSPIEDGYAAIDATRRWALTRIAAGSSRGG